jgi:hypothetical protein
MPGNGEYTHVDHKGVRRMIQSRPAENTCAKGNLTHEAAVTAALTTSEQDGTFMGLPLLLYRWLGRDRLWAYPTGIWREIG